MSSQNWRQYLPRKFRHGRQSKANSFSAPWLISSLLACMQLNVALLNVEISYGRRRVDICKLFSLSTGQNGRQKQLKRVGMQCRPRRFWVRPGRTSAWWDNFVNPHWIWSESEYVWTGQFDMNTLWSHNVWTRIFSYPERKSCRFKNIRISVDGALDLLTHLASMSCSSRADAKLGNKFWQPQPALSWISKVQDGYEHVGQPKKNTQISVIKQQNTSNLPS